MYSEKVLRHKIFTNFTNQCPVIKLKSTKNNKLAQEHTVIR